MSKSSRKKHPTPVKPVANKVVGTTPSATPNPSPITSKAVQEENVTSAKVTDEKSFELIRFDKRVKWFLGICVSVFLLLVLTKIHYSAITMWNQILPDGSDPRRGLLIGTPKQIRMDDWAGASPMTFSQVNNNFPLENQALGGEKPALVCGVPVKHIITFFRIENAGYLFLDLDRGFAWEWNYFAFSGLIAVFLLLLALTRNQFWLSVLGALWLIMSPGVAWWSMVNLAFIGSGCLLLLSSLIIFFARSIKSLIWGGLLYIWSMGCFVSCLYPPYMVPFGYLLILTLIGFTWKYYDRKILLDKFWLKIATLGISITLAGSILYKIYDDAKSTFDTMSNTVYPGRRSESGGTGFVANWLSEYYSGWLLKDTSIPNGWMNICELSHFVTLTPVIACCMIIYFFKTRKFDPLLVLLIAYAVFLMVWIEVGLPEFLAKATLIDMSPTRRTQIPLGLVNVFIAILYLAYSKTQRIKVPFTVSSLLWAGVVLFMGYAAWLNLEDAKGFYKVHQLFLPTLFFIAINGLLLPSVSFKGKEHLVALGLVLFSFPSLKINAIGIGTAPITEHAFYKKVKEIHDQDPKARWAVFGNQYLTYLVTATGANQLSGMKYMPDYKTMRVLDPQMKRDSAYNRFAHVVYSSYIDGKDSVVIFNPYEDAYTVAMDACSPRLKTLNTKYFVFDKVPQPVEIRCMTQIDEWGNIKIYKRNDI